jgi:hypothetical protein
MRGEQIERVRGFCPPDWTDVCHGHVCAARVCRGSRTSSSVRQRGVVRWHTCCRGHRHADGARRQRSSTGGWVVCD